MTAAQERALLLAALDYVAADRLYVRARKAHIRAKREVGSFSCEEERYQRASVSSGRALAKARLLRAAGVFRKQPLLPLEKARK